MRRKGIPIGLAMLAVIIFASFVPVIPTFLAAYYKTPQPPAGSPQPWYSSDPGGAYSGYTFSNGTSTMSLTDYNRLLHDPYTRLCTNSGVKIEGSTALFTCNSPDATPLPPPPNAFVSVVYALTGHGGLFVNGRYFLR